ncbi:MAG: M43 family zinc metalloprotease [Bacteroidota bacterium]|nr:M43 family zinc metalloprotease [Bacteroidota bacterium]
MFERNCKSALLSLFSLLLALNICQAQEVEPCGIYNSTVRTFGLTPDQIEAMSEASHQLEMETKIANLQGEQRDDLIIIPIVFHIIHFNGPENISNGQIYNAVEVLNRDFRALNEDQSQVVDAFTDIIADVEIEFRLAKKDPYGNCHPGITRTVSQLTFEGEDDVKNLVSWPRDMYLNIWVCEEAAGAAGYAYLPGSVDNWGDAWLDGIVIQNSYTGAIGTSNTFRSRTLTHEVGHWLNLRHLWGGSNTPGEPENCDWDDNVDDTPLSMGWTTCDVDGESCGSLDNVQNYMEYSYCGRMFTEGQKTRMRTAALSSTSDRNELSTISNLNATGVEGVPLLCEANFSVDKHVVCVGDGVQFTDMSYHDVSNWSWDFGDGTILSGGDEEEFSNPYHVFDVEGVYEVVLTASNSASEESSTPMTITVLSAGSMDTPAQQGFEVGEYPSDHWFIEDVLQDGSWELNDDVAYTGDRCLHIENWSNDIEFNKDYFISSTMDMTGVDEIRINYKWAYCFKGTSEDDETDDRLRISVTGDCGNDWDLRKMHRGFTDLPSTDPHFYPFEPAGDDEWNEYTLVLSQSIYQTEFFRVMFEFESRLGNDIFLDDINITTYDEDMLVLEEWTVGPNWSLYPNPSDNGVSNLSCSTILVHDAVIKLVDIQGRIVEHVYSGNLKSGQHNFELNPDDKPRGTYFVVIELDGKPQALPWVIQ